MSLTYKEGLTVSYREISKVDFRKAELVKQYKQIELNTNCPVCGSPLDAQHREQELDSIKNQLREVLMQRKLLDKQYETVNEFYQKTKADLEVKQEAVANINNDYRVILQAIQKHQKVLSDHDNAIVTLQSRLDSAIRTLEGLQRVPEPIDREQERITLRDKIKAQKGELLALEKEKTALEDVVKVYSNAGVKSHVLDLITPFLNEHGNTYLNALAGPDMELVFNTQTSNKDGSMSEKFDVKLLNANGGDEYKGNSEGEKKRADLSICLALQDYVKQRAESSMNFEVYDEVFDALDEVGSENVITLLKERKKVVGTIFVVTHNEHLKPLFEKKITVTKGKNGISTINEGEEAS
jgi:DNA repair exonuclease SbcCD ATPase subunit